VTGSLLEYKLMYNKVLDSFWVPRAFGLFLGMPWSFQNKQGVSEVFRLIFLSRGRATPPICVHISVCGCF
jgi:hypothetical protein